MKRFVFEPSVLLAALAILMMGNPVFSQNRFSLGEGSGVQVGISAKGSVEFLEGIPQFRLGINAGVGSAVLSNAVYPSLNLEWQVYYRGLGTRSSTPKSRHDLTSDIILAGTLTGGINYQLDGISLQKAAWRNKPLYYFTEFVQPALQNPFRYSLSIGSNILLAMDPGKKKFQRIGFINAHVGTFQFNYYNDGGGFQSVGIGDGEDRYFTGGGFAAVNLDGRKDLNQFSLSYHKFSGFYPGAFDLASDMDLTFVNYKNPDEAYYNKSFWSLSVGNVTKGWSGFIRSNNIYNRIDFQNFIHYSGTDAYHQIPYPRYFSVGGSYSGLNTKIGNK